MAPRSKTKSGKPPTHPATGEKRGDTQGQKSSLLDRVKVIVEILAVLIGGVWTGYEFLYQRTVERLEGRKLAWASLSLRTEAVKIDSKRYWVLVRLQAENDSQRPVTPLLVSWWVKFPPSQGTVDPRPYKMWNEAEHLAELRPGQETEFSWPVIVEGPPAGENPSAIFVRAEMYFVQVRDGERCIIHPNETAVENMTTQPTVCVRDETSQAPKCLEPLRPCLYEYVEAFQRLSPDTKEGGE